MARQVVDIGVEGNDGTGDALRESFRKVNENFTELYAAFGIEGNLTFASLSDTPEDYDDQENQVLVVNSDSNGVTFRELVSNGYLSGDIDDDTVRFDFTAEGHVVVTTRNSQLVDDKSPTAGGPMDMASFGIGRVGTTTTAATNFTTKHGISIEQHDLVPDIKYVDENYLARGSAGEHANVRSEPSDATEYTLSITSYSSGYAVVSSHGLTRASTGAAYTYGSTGTAATGLVNETTYYIRRTSTNNIGLYPSAADARADTNRILVSGGSGTQTLVNNSYNSELAGYWMTTEALPRTSVVRRQGDTMAGALYLNDHPGELAGVVGPNGTEDYQAATKYYVDENSYFSTNTLYVNSTGDDSMTGIPLAKHGRSQKAAFRTIRAACEKAEEIMLASAFEPGPYLQTITYNDTADRSVTTTVGIQSPVAGRDAVQNLLSWNKSFIQEEVIAYVNQTYPTLIYDETYCRRDIGLIIDSIILDVLSGNNANYLSRYAGLRYYSNPSALKAIGDQLTQTLDALSKLRSLVNDVLQNNVVTSLQTGSSLITQVIDVGEVVGATGLASSLAKIDIITDIIDNGPLEAPTIVDGSVYELTFTNGGFGNVDQGDPNNTDILPGKVIRGKQSGAIARIINYFYEDDPNTVTPTNNDRLECYLLEPVEFIAGEELEYGNTVNNTQITIFVESGIYYEDFPIKVPNNTSIVGDEFRRVIVRPADRVSQSRWANTYFYRDAEFDGLTGDSASVTGFPENGLPTVGVESINPLTNAVDGYFGRHYLNDPTNDIDISSFGATNAGGYEEAAALINRNKDFIAEEIIYYINATYPSLVYNTTTCRRDVGLILDSVISDLINGGRAYSLRAQGAYYYQAAQNVILSQATETAAAINYIKTVAASVLANTAFGAKLGTVDQIIDTDYDAESGSDTAFNSLINLIAYAFDTDYNPPKHNRDIDIFMVNDATVIRNLSVQGHGGFMVVLDPTGQILTKSPYCQALSSVAQSIGRQSFRGGIYNDAYTANIPVIVSSVDDEFTLNITSVVSSGLYVRRPQVPAPFYIDGRRFQVNTITDYDQATGTATFILDRTSNNGDGFTGVTSLLPTGVDLDDLPVNITLQTAGTRTILANEFTQVNDLSYGLVCVNGGMAELVSVFTYYNWAAFYAKNGAAIRALNCSNSYGEYGIVADGADPNEIPDEIVLRDNMVMPFRTFTAEVILKVADIISVVSGETITQTTSGAFGTVVFDVNSKTIFLINVTGTFDTSNQLTGSTSGALGVNSIPSSVTTSDYQNEAEDLGIYAFDFDHIPTNQAEVDVLHTSGTLSRYEVANVTKLTGVIADSVDNPTITTYVGAGTGLDFIIGKTVDNGYQIVIIDGGADYEVSETILIDGADLGGVTSTNDATITITAVDSGGAITTASVTGTVSLNDDTPNKNGQVYLLNFTQGSSEFTTDNGLTENTPAGLACGYRHNQIFAFEDVFGRDSLVSDPLAAIVLDENTLNTYRSISASGIETSTGDDLPTGEAYVTFDETFDYIRVSVDSGQASSADVRGGGGTMGSSVGDTIIAISQLVEETDINRLNTGNMIFTWGGKVHKVTNYVDRTTYATIEITDVNESSIVDDDSSSNGLSLEVVQGSQVIILRIGLEAGAAGTITKNISTVRATGHDFLNVGTGGYNTSNFPNVLLGEPRDPVQTNEVTEVNKGRVYYVSTDQDGFFRVGRFFTVDQGTGSVTFSASIALSNLDGFGFKRGVVVSEFSTDSAMTENATDIVPVQNAIRTYVNRRLGFNHAGLSVSNKIGPGAVAADGSVALTGDLNMASHQINNLAAPTSGSDAATKTYVDSSIGSFNQFSELRNSFADTWASDQIIVSTGKKKIYVNNVVNGPFAIADSISNGSGGTGTIVDVVTVASDVEYGSSILITYTSTGGTIAEGNTITSGIKSATVLNDPFNEITNADVTGDVTPTVTRTSSGSGIVLNITAGSIVNADVNASAAIAQSKLAMSAATTRASASGISQSDLGLASFDSSTFTASSGWISITAGSLALSKLANIANNTVIGNVSGSAAAPTTISTTTGSGASSVLITRSDGSIRVESLRLGGNDTYEILSLTGTQLNIKTPAQGVVLTANGASNPTVNIPGNLNIGAVSGSESTLQQNSGLAAQSSISADWTYSSFIEAPGERTAASTGVAIGASTGRTSAGEIGILVANTVGSTTLMPFKFDKTGVIPDVDNSYNIGSASFKYNTIYASTFSGNATTSTTATQADTLKVDGGSYRAAATAATANTVAARDASGNLTANVFNGVATSARYADLAENYIGSKLLDPGTVVIFGGKNEVDTTNVKGDHRAAGVVSTNPAYLMNNALEGEYVVSIALTGRVPTKVLGKVQKGDLIVTSGVSGYGCVDNNARAGTIIGKSLEDKNDDGYGIIEVVVGKV